MNMTQSFRLCCRSLILLSRRFFRYRSIRKAWPKSSRVRCQHVTRHERMCESRHRSLQVACGQDSNCMERNETRLMSKLDAYP